MLIKLRQLCAFIRRKQPQYVEVDYCRQVTWITVCFGTARCEPLAQDAIVGGKTWKVLFTDELERDPSKQ